jgi:hypothetical protein
MTETPQPVAPAPVLAPVMDVVAPPPLAHPPGEAASASTTPQLPKANIPTPALAKPKSAKQGVTAAIVATVIIVLGLAVLAVLAYIKQK